MLNIDRENSPNLQAKSLKATYLLVILSILLLAGGIFALSTQ